LNNLAGVYYDLGRKEEAVAIYRQCMEISPRVRGADHPTTFAMMLNVGSVDIDLKRYDEAGRLLKQALEGLRRVRGADHPDTYYALLGLGALDVKLKRYDNAEKLLLQAREGLSRTLGPSSRDTNEARYTLALLAAARGRPAEALSGLAALVDDGFRNAAQMEKAEEFLLLRDDPEFQRILAAARRNADPKIAAPAGAPPPSD
jgi:tetratricopeptide (TPR) repeat protein